MRALLLVVMAAFFAGCSPVKPPSSDVAAPPARIDEASLLRAHPFAPLVAQLDDDLQTLRAASADDPGRASAAIRASADAIRSELTAGSARARTLPQGIPATYGPSTVGYGSAMADQLARYRAALDARMERAIALRKQQLTERELTVGYQFDRAHAGERLQLQLRLDTLHLDAGDRRALEDRLHSLDAQDRAAVARQQNINRVDLAAYRAALTRETATRLTSLQRDVAAQSSAMRSLHSNDEVVRAEAARLAARSSGADLAAAFAQASADLSARFAQLRSGHGQAASAAAAEVASLQAERRRLIAEMRAQIEAQAETIARGRGFGHVYTGAAPADATDLTDAVKDALSTIRG